MAVLRLLSHLSACTKPSFRPMDRSVGKEGEVVDVVECFEEGDMGREECGRVPALLEYLVISRNSKDGRSQRR